MKKVIVKALVFVVSFLVGMGIARMAKAQDNKAGFLWKVSGNGLAQPSYVYGTIHMICAEDFTLDASVNKAFAQSEALVMELDMDDSSMVTEMQMHMVNPKMENIAVHLSEEEQELLNDFLKTNYGADLTRFGILKPFSLMSMMVTKLITCSDIKSYEQEFLKMAKKQEKSILGLESVKRQLTIFDDVDDDIEADWLVSMLKEREKQQAVFVSMSNAYKQQDLEGLFEIMNESPEMIDYADLLLFKRNAEWISKMEAQMKLQGTFFAVGAGHLPSDKGVLQLLREKGYTVEAVKQEQ